MNQRRVGTLRWHWKSSAINKKKGTIIINEQAPFQLSINENISWAVEFEI